MYLVVVSNCLKQGRRNQRFLSYTGSGFECPSRTFLPKHPSSTPPPPPGGYPGETSSECLIYRLKQAIKGNQWCYNINTSKCLKLAPIRSRERSLIPQLIASSKMAATDTLEGFKTRSLKSNFYMAIYKILYIYLDSGRGLAQFEVLML